MKRLPIGLLTVMVFALGIAANIPPPDGYVNDLAGALSPESKAKLTQMTQALKADKDVELGILIVETTSGQDIAEYATQVARAWGIGSKEGEHRGMLFVLATKDRKNFLTASRHFEGDFPDLVCKDLCKAGRAQFAKGEWAAGTETVVGKISERVNAVLSKQQAETPLPDSAGQTSGPSPLIFGLLLLGAGTGTTALVMRHRRKKREEEERELASARLRAKVQEAEWQKRKEAEVERRKFAPPPEYQPRIYSPPARKKEESKPKRENRSSYSSPEPSHYSPPEPSRRDDSSSSWGSSGSSDSGGGGSFGGGGDFGGSGGGDGW